MKRRRNRKKTYKLYDEREIGIRNQDSFHKRTPDYQYREEKLRINKKRLRSMRKSKKRKKGRKKSIYDLNISRSTANNKHFKIVVKSIIDIIVAKLDDKLEKIEDLIDKNLDDLNFVKRETHRAQMILYKDENLDQVKKKVQLFNCDKRFFHKLFKSKKGKSGFKKPRQVMKRRQLRSKSGQKSGKKSYQKSRNKSSFKKNPRKKMLRKKRRKIENSPKKKFDESSVLSSSSHILKHLDDEERYGKNKRSRKMRRNESHYPKNKKNSGKKKIKKFNRCVSVSKMIGIYTPSSMKKTKSQVLREIASQEKLKKIKSKSNFDEKIKKLKKSTSFKNYQNSKSRPKKKRKKSTEKIYTNFHHLTNELTEESEAFSTFDQRKKDSIYGGMPRLNISSTFQSMESNMAIPPNTGITKAQQLVNGGVIFEDFNEDVESSKRKNSSKSRLIQNMSYLTDQDRAERGKISELYTNAKNYDLGSFYHNEKDVPNVANHVTFKQKMRMLENKKFQEQVFKEKKKKRIERSKDFIIEKRIQHNDIFNEVQVKKVNGKSRSKRSRVSLEPNEDSSILFNFMKKVDHLTKSSLDMNYSVDNKSYEENLISMKRSLISKSKDERSSRVKKVKENEYKSNQDLSNVEEIQKESFNFGINGNNKNSLKIGELYETFNKETSHQKIMKKLMPSELSSIGKQFEDTFLDQKKLQNNSLVKLNSQFLGMLGQENSINKSFRDLKEMLDFEYSDLKSSNKEPRNRSRLNSASSRRKRSSSRSKENNKNLKSNLFSRTLLFQDDIKDISSKEINKLISRKNRARSKRSIVDKPNISPLKKQPLTSTRKGGEISERTKMKMLIENDIDYPDRKRKVKNYDIESPFEDIKTKQKPSYTNEETQDSLQAIKNNLSKNQTFIQKKENVDIYKTSREPTPTYSVHLERKFGKEKRGKSRKKKDKSMKKNRSRKVLWSKVMGAVERLSKPRSKPNSKVSSSRKRQSNNSSKRSISRLEKTESIQNVKLKNSFDKVSIRSKKLKEKTKKKGKQFRKKSSNKRRKSSKKKNLSRISSTGSLRKKSIQSKRRRSTSTSKKKVVKMNKEHHRSKTFSFAKQEKKFQIQNTETTKIESASPTEENDTFDDEIKPVVSSFLRLNPPNDGMFSNKIIFDNIHNVEFDAQPVEIIPNPGKSDDKNTTSFNFSELKKELLGFVNPETFETKIQNSDADKISLNHGVMRERIDSAFTFGQGGEKQLSPTEKEKNPLVKKSTFGPQNSKLMADSLGFNSYRSIEEEIFKGEYTEITSTLEISNKNHFLKKIETTQKIITKSTENIITPEESVNRASISIPYSEDFTDNFSVSYSFDPNEGLSRRGTLKGFAPSEISKNDERTSSASKNRNSFHVSNLSKTLKRQSMKSSVSSQITGFRGTEGSFDPNEVNTVDDEDDEGRCSENGEIEIGNKKLSEDTPNNLSVRKAAYVSGNGQQRHSVNISPMKFSGSQRTFEVKDEIITSPKNNQAKGYESGGAVDRKNNDEKDVMDKYGFKKNEFFNLLEVKGKKEGSN